MMKIQQNRLSSVNDCMGQNQFDTFENKGESKKILQTFVEQSREMLH